MRTAARMHPYQNNAWMFDGCLTSETRATLTAGRIGCRGKVPRRQSNKNGMLAQNTQSSMYPIRPGIPETERYRSPAAVITASRQNRSRRYGGEEGERTARPRVIPLCNRQSYQGVGHVYYTLYAHPNDGGNPTAYQPRGIGHQECVEK